LLRRIHSCNSCYSWLNTRHPCVTLEGMSAYESEPNDDADDNPIDTGIEMSVPPRRQLFTRKSVGVLLVICIAAGYLAMGRQKAVRQAEAMQAVADAGGHVYLDYQWDNGQIVPDAKRPEARWLRALVGETMLNRAVAVDLRGIERPDELAQTLRLLPYLHTIRADDSAVTDASLLVWCTMPGLTNLNLAGTSITDTGVVNLASLTQLTRLDVSRTAISDHATQALSTLRRLEHLNLANTKVTVPAVEQLRTTLPKCQVLTE